MAAVKAKIDFRGQTYSAFMSLRVMKEVEERYGETFQKAVVTMLKGAKLEDLIWFVAQIMDAGYKYELKNGGNPPIPPTEEDMLDMLDYDDIIEITESIHASVKEGSGSIAVKPPKNAEAALEAES